MSAITFPNTPTAGDQHTVNGITYTFTDGTWVAVGQSNFYTLPIGSPTVLGGVKGGGTGITIANDGVISSSVSSLSNITDSAQGVNVTGKVATTDGIDIDTGGNINAAGTSVDFGSATISFSGATISGLSSKVNDWVDTHLNQSGPTDGHVLSWDTSANGGNGDYAWVAQTTDTVYANTDVDNHLNQSNPTSGYVLSWNGTDYAWVDNAGYSNTDVDNHLNQSNPTAKLFFHTVMF